MGAESDGIANALEAIETPKARTTGEQDTAVGLQGPRPMVPLATTPQQNSAADLQLLQSLDAKLKELAGRVSIRIAPKPRTAAIVASAGERALPPAASPPLDSTQTVRPLTPPELSGTEAARWFAIELQVFAHEIEAAEVPNLGIFEEYRLYSVIAPDQGRLVHALRVGFFSSAVAADAVVRHLRAHFPSATIKRVSAAERERFADKLIRAGKDIGASGQRAVIELAGALSPRASPRRPV